MSFDIAGNTKKLFKDVEVELKHRDYLNRGDVMFELDGRPGCHNTKLRITYMLAPNTEISSTLSDDTNLAVAIGNVMREMLLNNYVRHTVSLPRLAREYI